jgi:hypothetical protein
VIDLPRLAHSLLRRPSDDDRSPPPDGVPLAWACRGCGQSLDPSREVACAQCGHPVVAPSLLDINPPLAAIETRLLQAEQSARPYRQRPPRPPRSWRDTGLGMLERFWRNEDLEPREQMQMTLLFAVVLLFVVWLAWVKR